MTRDRTARHFPILIDFRNMMGAEEGGGIDPARFPQAGASASTRPPADFPPSGSLRAAAASGPAPPLGELDRRFRLAHAAVESLARDETGFIALPGDRVLAARTRALANSLAPRRFSDVVVIGIGGSALGAAALHGALGDPSGGHPMLHILDNPDPDSVAPLLDRLDYSRTLFNVVSKSGSTAETLALFALARGRLALALGEEAVRRHIVVTTDPERGFLRAFAREHDLPTLPVPPGTGGRFSALSPAGLFPAAMTGIDIEAVLAGARATLARCASPSPAANPAGTLATLLHHADTELGLGVHVFMPYADRLRAFAYWVQQLWAESLGKARHTDGGPAGTGSTPLPAFGPADQHSLLQLFMEGPRDKVIVFLRRQGPERDLGIPALPSHHPAIPGWLAHTTLFELLDREQIATAEALRRAGRPNLTITLNRIEPFAVGALVMLFQLAVVHAGALYGVNPLDQPGVELGKKILAGLLGRPGSSPVVFPSLDSRWRV